MAYIINGFDGRPITTIEDGTVDQTLDIKLVGKNYAGYGEIQNETFVHMLENFASTSPPPNALPGQLWYDSANKKIKFHYATGSGGVKLWKTAGGVEYSATEPSSPTAGDLWFDTSKGQLKTRTESSGWTVIGPQVAGSGVTQMQSRTLKATGSIDPISVIVALVNDEPVYVISRSEFTIDPTDLDSVLPGFSVIKQGITLAYANSTTGITGETTDHIMWGTAANANLLDGYAATDFIFASGSNFTSLATFADAGFTVGDDDDLAVRVDGLTVIVENTTPESKISVRIRDTGGAVVNLMTLDASGSVPLIEPGVNNAYDIGSSVKGWRNIYATTFTGTATKADTLKVGTEYRSASTTATVNTIAVRDGSGNLVANQFTGTATQAETLKVGSVFRSSSTAASADTVAVRNGSGNLIANIFVGNLTGNVTGNVTGNSTTATTAAQVTLTETLSTNATHYINFTNASTGNQAVRTDTGLTYNPSTNTVTATTFSGALTGNATSATNLAGGAAGGIPYQTAGSSTSFVPIGSSGYVLTSTGTSPTWTPVSGLSGGSAAQIEVTNTTTTAGTYHVTFTSGTSGAQTLRVDSATLTYNPNTNTLTSGTFSGTATQAQYADLAEKYLADQDYEAGTVVAVGGEKEVTACKFGDRALGVVSTNPAFMMNKDLEGGTYIALKGRVPVKVIGSINKGDRLVASDNGYAIKATHHQYADVFAIALESNSNVEVKVVECVVL